MAESDVGNYIGSYKTVGLLKRGGFSSVYLAEEPSTGRLVALKLCPREQVAASGFAEAEVLCLMRLRHPHIVQLEEIFLTDHHLVMALEYASGGDLASFVPAGKGIPEDEARWLFLQLLFALDYCHRMGVASRDVKLENLLTNGGLHPIIHLADFGLAVECQDSHPRSNKVVGTPAYVAPEVITASLPGGSAYAAKKADIWSAGVVLYVLVTGCCPFQRAGDSLLSYKERLSTLFKRVLSVDYAPALGVSPMCRDLLARIFVADPSQRPSVRQLLYHPWCSQGSGAPEITSMLRCNDFLIARSLANPPSAELLDEVRDILREAAMGPATPTAIAVKAHMGESDVSEWEAS